MATDTRCPACGAKTPLAKAAAASLEVRAAFDPTARRQLAGLKTVRGLVMILLGLGLGAGGVYLFMDTSADQAPAKQVTAADLLRIDRPDALPDWLSYSPNMTIETGVEYVKMRSRAVTSKFVLLAVKDHWLIAKVNKRYDGGRIEGKLCDGDNLALSKIRSAFPTHAGGFLPYQLDAEIDQATTHRRNYILGASGAVLCLMLCFTGVRNLISRSPSFPVAAMPVSAAIPGALPGSRPLRTASLQAPGDAVTGSPRPLTSQPQWQDTPADDFGTVPAPRGRSVILLVILGIVYPVVFFLAATVIVSVVSVLRAGNDPELGKQLARQAGEKFGLMILFGSASLSWAMTYLGWLPGTRRR
jgi:hypothetical protein